MAEIAGNSASQRTIGKPFKKGVSGNPSGRPKGFAKMQEAFRKLTPKAKKALLEALADDKLKVAAALAILDRGWGKPSQPIEGPDGQAAVLSFSINLGDK